MQKQRLFNKCLLLTIIAVAFLWAGYKGHQVGERYEKEGVDVTVIVDEYYRIRFHTTYLGSYIYKGNYFSNVEITNAGSLYVGEKVPCKVLLDNPHRAEYAGDKSNVAEYFMYGLVAVFILAAVFSIYNYVECCRVLKHGFVEIGIVRSVEEEEKSFIATVEFEDHNGNLQTAKINMGKRMLLVGQKILLKYQLDKYGKAIAYHYDNRREI